MSPNYVTLLTWGYLTTRRKKAKIAHNYETMSRMFWNLRCMGTQVCFPTFFAIFTIKQPSKIAADDTFILIF